MRRVEPKATVLRLQGWEHAGGIQFGQEWRPMTPGPLSLVAMAGFLVWLYLAFGRHSFWRADQTLAANLPAPETWPPVVAIVPARNEAALIRSCLSSVANQNYPGLFRVILVDDSSTDDTTEIARSLTCKAPIEVAEAPPLPEGWTGKLWALSNGVEHAAETEDAISDAFLWFTDADIMHGTGVLRALTAKALAEQRDMVSLMVKLNASGIGDRWLLPAFVFFFQKLYPFADVNREGGRAAAAAGGCILIRSKILEKAGGIAAIRGELIDDCALARRVKEAGGRLWLGLAEESWSMRTYGFRKLWQMVARTAYTQLNHSVLLLLGTVLAMVFVYLVPPLLFLSLPLHGDVLAAGAGLGAWLIMAALYGPTLTYYRRPHLEGALLPLIAGLYTLMTIHSAVDHWRGRGSRWKAREYVSK